MKKILFFVPIFLFFLMSVFFKTDVSAHEFKASQNALWYEEYNKNILYFSNKSRTNNGVTYKMENGVIYLDGTCTNDFYIPLAEGYVVSDITGNNLLNNYQGKSLSMWWDNNFNVVDGSTGELTFFNNLGDSKGVRVWNNNVAYFTFSNTSRNFSIKFLLKKGTNYDNCFLKIMLVEGHYNKLTKLAFQPNLKYIYDSGFQHGHYVGYDKGYKDGYDDGYLTGLEDYRDNVASIFYNSKISLYFEKNKNYKKEFNPIFNNQYLKFNNIGDFIDKEYNSGNDLIEKYGNPYVNISLSNEIIGQQFSFLFKGIMSIEVIFKDGNKEYIAIPDNFTETPVTLSNINSGKIITNIIFKFPPNSDTFYDGYAYYTNSDFNDGYNLGYEAGHIEGYNNGYNKGYEIGKNKGIEIGSSLVENNTNAFINIIVAISNIPINILSSLFSFDLFGINLFGALTSLLSVGLIIFVIRKFFK